MALLLLCGTELVRPIRRGRFDLAQETLTHGEPPGQRPATGAPRGRPGSSRAGQFRTSRTAATILSGVGLTKASWVGAADTGASGRATRTIGLFREWKPCSATIAAISAPTPQLRRVSSATTSRPVLATEE